MSIVGDLASLGIGIGVGEAVADEFVGDNNLLGHVAVNLLAGGVATAAAKTALKETGVDDILEDIFGF